MEQTDRFLGMLLCNLGANVLRNMLTNKRGGGGRVGGGGNNKSRTRSDKHR